MGKVSGVLGLWGLGGFVFFFLVIWKDLGFGGVGVFISLACLFRFFVYKYYLGLLVLIGLGWAGLR